MVKFSMFELTFGLFRLAELADKGCWGSFSLGNFPCFDCYNAFMTSLAVAPVASALPQRAFPVPGGAVWLRSISPVPAANLRSSSPLSAVTGTSLRRLAVQIAKQPSRKASEQRLPPSGGLGVVSAEAPRRRRGLHCPGSLA